MAEHAFARFRRLHQEAALLDDTLQELFQERVAIMEVDACLAHEQAIALAHACVYGRNQKVA